MLFQLEELQMHKSSRIFVAGHRGLVGSAIMRALISQGYKQINTAIRSELDLTDRREVINFFESEKPEYVFLAAAKVGGILSNSSYPADFIYDNLLIQTNVIDTAYRTGTKRLLFLGSSCIYPKFAPQPLKEEHLLTSALEESNEAYAIAKISGIKMCQAYEKQYGFDSICLMPTNLYGQNDNFDLHTSHVMPALIRKFHEAKMADSPSVNIWGTGTPKREFLLSDDLADGALFLMNQPRETIKSAAPDGIFNVGTGKDITIKELCYLIADIVGYRGALEFDSSKPDGTPRKVLDVSRLSSLGWQAKTTLRNGILHAYQYFCQNNDGSVKRVC
jgi:GDP-L-fucose synthase